MPSAESIPKEVRRDILALDWRYASSAIGASAAHRGTLADDQRVSAFDVLGRATALQRCDTAGTTIEVARRSSNLGLVGADDPSRYLRVILTEHLEPTGTGTLVFRTSWRF